MARRPPDPESARWAFVPGYPEYQVSTDGQVRSIGRKVKIRRWAGAVRWQPGKLLTPSGTGRKKYPTVSLYRGGQARRVTVHRLVLEAFIGPCPPGHEAWHKDDDPTNAALSNLYWRPVGNDPAFHPTRADAHHSHDAKE